MCIITYYVICIKKIVKISHTKCGKIFEGEINQKITHNTNEYINLL